MHYYKTLTKIQNFKGYTILKCINNYILVGTRKTVAVRLRVNDLVRDRNIVIWSVGNDKKKKN